MVSLVYVFTKYGVFNCFFKVFIVFIKYVTAFCSSYAAFAPRPTTVKRAAALTKLLRQLSLNSAEIIRRIVICESQQWKVRYNSA